MNIVKHNMKRVVVSRSKSKKEKISQSMPKEPEFINMGPALLSKVIKQENEEIAMPQPIVYMPIKHETTLQSKPVETEFMPMEFSINNRIKQEVTDDDVMPQPMAQITIKTERPSQPMLLLEIEPMKMPSLALNSVIKQEVIIDDIPPHLDDTSNTSCSTQLDTEKSSEPTVEKTRAKKLSSFSVNDKHMIINTYNYVEKSWPNDIYPYKKEMTQKTANILGISVSSVYRVLKDYKQHGKCSSPAPKHRATFTDKIDDLSKSAIRKKVHAFFLKGELPTTYKVLDDVNEDDLLPNFKRTTFQKLLKHLKFKVTTRNGNSAIIDRDDVVVGRRKYLSKVKEYREKNRPIFYLDETWVNIGPTNKSWNEMKSKRKTSVEGSKNSTSKDNRLIIAHIGSEVGFVADGSCVFESKPMDAEQFENWFEYILPKLGKNALVIMDNAPYHLRKQEKAPNWNWIKSDIQLWLRDKDIHYDENDIKLQLLKKVKQVKGQYQKYAVDELAKKYDVEVLIIPPYHNELNPIEQIWPDLKGHVARNSTTLKLEEVKQLVIEGIERITADRWKECLKHIKIEEEKFYQLDLIMDDVTDTFMTSLKDSEPESTDSEESMSE